MMSSATWNERHLLSKYVHNRIGCLARYIEFDARFLYRFRDTTRVRQDGKWSRDAQFVGF